MTVLALDFGGSCGWAIGKPLAGTAVISGIVNLAPGRDESPGMRYVRLRSHLFAVLSAHPDLSLIITEAAHHRGAAATKYAAGYQTHLESWCAEYSSRAIQHTSVHAAKLKKWATGTGKGNKDEMLRLGRERFGATLSTTTTDEVDARWLLAYALEVLVPGLPA